MTVSNRLKPTDMRVSYKKADFPKGLVRGNYAGRIPVESNMVRLDPEIHAAFPTSKAVNEALGGLLRVAKSIKLSKRATGSAVSKNRSAE